MAESTATAAQTKGQHRLIKAIRHGRGKSIQIKWNTTPWLAQLRDNPGLLLADMTKVRSSQVVEGRWVQRARSTLMSGTTALPVNASKKGHPLKKWESCRKSVSNTSDRSVRRVLTLLVIIRLKFRAAELHINIMSYFVPVWPPVLFGYFPFGTLLLGFWLMPLPN